MPPLLCEFTVVKAVLKWEIGTVRVSGSLGVAMSHSPLAVSAGLLRAIRANEAGLPTGKPFAHAISSA